MVQSSGLPAPEKLLNPSQHGKKTISNDNNNDEDIDKNAQSLLTCRKYQF